MANQANQGAGGGARPPRGVLQEEGAPPGARGLAVRALRTRPQTAGGLWNLHARAAADVKITINDEEEENDANATIT